MENKYNYVRAKAPATVANVACGFDVLGFALENPFDEIEIWLNDTGVVSIQNILGDEGKLPRESNKNASSVVVSSYLKKINSNKGAEIILHKHMASGTGLGSSAASAVVAGFAINALFNSKLSKKELLPICIDGEEAACGARIVDNVSASLFGGFVLARDVATLDIVSIPTPQDLYCAVVYPHIQILTKEAREILPTQFSLKTATQQCGNIAGLILGLTQNDFELIGRSLVDNFAEPFRKNLIPHFDEVKEVALKSNALGCSISGSGPSIFSLCKGENLAQIIGKKMQQIFIENNVQVDLFISKINQIGPEILLLK